MSDLPGPLDPHGSFDNWMMVNGPYLASGCLTFFGGGMLIGGIMAIRDGIRAKRVAAVMHTFQSVPGEVLTSMIITRYTKYGVALYVPQIEYAYSINGKNYKSISILPGQFTESNDQAWAQQWVDAYPVGRQLEVFYDPRQPNVCVVERQAAHVPKDAGGTIGLGIVLTLIAMWALWTVAVKILPEGGKWPDEIPKPPAEAALDGSYPEPESGSP